MIGTDLTIDFYLSGADRNTTRVRAGEFVFFVGRLLAALKATDTAINGGNSKDFHLSNLQIGSAAGTLSEFVVDSKISRRHTFNDVCGALKQVLEAAQSDAAPPSWAGPELLIKIRELAEPLSHVSTIKLSGVRDEITLDDQFRRKLLKFVGPDVTSSGSIVGTLEGVNWHTRMRAFLYPGRGEEGITCDFNSEVEPQVVALMKKRVRVFGTMTRRENSHRPFRVQIRSLEELPPDADLPLFRELIGVTTLNETSHDYLEELREEDD